MRILAVAALGLGVGLSAAPAVAQNLGDVGRQLKEQFLPGQNQPDRDRDAYEQGRRDQADQARRQRESGRSDDRRGNYDDRRRSDDRSRRGVEEADRDRRSYDRDAPRSCDRDRQRPLDDTGQPRRY